MFSRLQIFKSHFSLSSYSSRTIHNQDATYSLTRHFLEECAWRLGNIRFFYAYVLCYSFTIEFAMWRPTMEDFESYIGKNLDRDVYDLLPKPYNNILTGRWSPLKRQIFRNYCRCLGRELNPGYQSDVLNAKRSQFVIKMSNNLSYVLVLYVLKTWYMSKVMTSS